MRILVISTSVVPLNTGRYGGVEKLCGDYIKGLVKFKQDVTVAAPIGSKVPEGVKLIETVKLPEEQDRDDLAWWQIGERHGPVAATIVHDFSHTHALARLSKTRLPAIFYCWNPVAYKYPQTSPYNVMCLSGWQKARFEETYNQKAIVMPMCVDTDIYKPIKNPIRERFLFLGKISLEKGVVEAIELCKEMGVPLDVVGGLIPTETNLEYVETVKKLCDGDKIRLHFNVTEEEKIGFLQNAKALIYPVMQEEAHWLAGMEAWCIGTPTVVFGVGAMPEVAPLSASTRAQFKTAMAYIDDFDTAKFREVAIQRYGVDSVIPQYLDLYKRVVEGERWA